MQYGEQRINGNWYFFDRRGAMVRSSIYVLPSGKTVYYDADGAMKYGVQIVPIIGECYFNYPDGSLVVNGWAAVSAGLSRWADESGSLSSLYSKMNSNGKRILVNNAGTIQNGWKKSGNATFYANGSGELATGMYLVDGAWYYFDPRTSAMAIGELRIGDNWYLFTADGKRASGVTWVQSGKKWCYYDLASGQMRYGEQWLSYDAAHRGWYHFDESTGAMTHGFYYNGILSKWVYYDNITGIMRHGLSSIDGSWYLLDSNTGAVTYGLSWVPERNAWKYFDLSTGKQTDVVNWRKPSGMSRPSLRYLSDLTIEVSIDKQQVYVKSGNRIVYAMVASTGMLNGQDNTPLGWYRITGRGYSFYNSSEGMGARYYTQFLGDYLFHSVPTDANGNYMPSEGAKLGQPASHGCVRLTVSDAEWFYNELPNGTSVWIH